MESSRDSQREFTSAAEGLREYLETVLPDSHLSEAPVHSEYEPLLLLRTKRILAAFALSNGDALASYGSLYGSFKKYYSDNGRLHGLSNLGDVAFVFCVRPDVPNLELLCSHIETNVYFCRKFVIRLVVPINKSLARLPFLPLTPVGTQTVRPPSAQTYLQGCGVPASLAKSLVVQRERSPERIVDDCMSGAFGEPRGPVPTSPVSVAAVERFAKPIRFENIVIQGFRAYRKPQTFRLGADVTVLYGPNGFGKTSFFDAIDFAVTGDVGRMKSDSDAHFRKVTAHLDSATEDSLVSLSFRSNGHLRKIERRIDNRKRASLDGRPTDRKTILAELTAGDFPSTDRVENFVSLFRATHLFSQEHQELMKDFDRDCELSANIVSRLLAFEDYANGANKAANVREILRTTVEELDGDIQELTQGVSNATEEIDKLGRTAQVHGGGAEISEAMESLRAAMTAAGVAVTDSGSHRTKVQRWRAAIEMRSARADARIDQLSEISKGAVTPPRLIADLARVRSQLGQAETALTDLREQQIAVTTRLQHAAQRLAEMSSTREAAQAYDETLRWIRATRPTYGKLLKTGRDVVDELERTNATLAELRRVAASRTEDLQTIRQRRDEARRAVEEMEGHLDALLTLDHAVGTWQSSRKRLTSLDADEPRTTQLAASLTTQEREIAGRRDALLATESRLRRHISEIDRGQSETRKLLLQLKGHVHRGTCPLCGADHRTTDELLRRIEEQTVADAGSTARKELRQTHENATTVAEELSLAQERLAAANAALTMINGERVTLVAQIRDFEESARAIGAPVDDTTPIYIRKTAERLRQEATKRRRDVEKLGDHEDAARVRVTQLTAEIAQSAAAVTEKETALADTQAEITQLRKDPRAARVSLEVDPKLLTNFETDSAQRLALLNADIERAEQSVERDRAGLTGIRQASSSREAELAELRGRVTSLEKSIAVLKARFREANLDPNANEEAVLSLVADESRVQAEILGLRDRALRLESAIDRATTAAALAQLRENVQSKQRLLTVARQKRARFQLWLIHFDTIADLILTRQGEATKDFTQEYGPRTSVIQRRLRSVYGFDDVEIHSHESTIRVRVKRGEDDLRPTDYFSQSQKQTLLLGIFLTTCLSQTWSAFSPVMLDDPVTHFDDLNTYAFLDLIAGLLELEPEGRQFIISTCDQKFLEVARQKFAHIGDRATFYTFSAIGAEGPVVETLAGI